MDSKMIKIFLTLFLISSPAWATTQWNPAVPASGDSKSLWPTQAPAQWLILQTLLQNYRQLMNLSYNSGSTLTIAAGEVSVTNGSAFLFLHNGSGTNITATSLDSGSSFANGTTYYVYAYQNSTTATSSSFFISTNSSAPTGATYYKRLGSFTTDGSANIQSSSIANDNFPSLLSIQNGGISFTSNVNLGGNTISNGKLGQTSTGNSGGLGNGATYNVPTGCYVSGVKRGGSGEIDQVQYSCP